MPKRILFFDLETYLFGPGCMLPKPVSIAWDDGNGRKLELADRIPAVLGPALEQAARGECVIAAFGTAYDMGVVLAHFPDLAHLIFEAYEQNGIVCVRVREKLLDIAVAELHVSYTHDGHKIDHQYNLADICKRRLGREMKKGEDTYRKRYADLDGVPVKDWPRPAVDYALDDLYGRDVLIDQEQRGRQIGYTMPTQFDDSRADFALRLMTAWGVHTDREKVETLYSETLSSMDELAEVLVHHGLARSLGGHQETLFGPREKPAVQKKMAAIRALVEQLYPGDKTKIPRTEKTNAIQTSKRVLEVCHHPGLDALVKFNMLQKTGSTYVLKMFDGVDYPIHSFFDGVGAATDRTSSSKPNLQNLPRMPGVRECFLTRKGKVFLLVDADTQEMRTWAQACLDLVGESRLARMYQEDPDFDPHTLFASEIYLKIPFAEALRRRAANDAIVEEARQVSKVSNFGFPGGLGWFGFMSYAKGYGLSLSETASKAAKEGWRQTWPEQKAYFEFVKAVIGSADYGRLVIPRTGFRRDGVGHNDCANTPFQHMAAMSSKRALWVTTRRCHDPAYKGVSWLYGSRVVNFVHDELDIETDPAVGHEAAKETEDIFARAQERYTPDVPARASAALSAVWSKKAKRVLDRGGRLVPWSPKVAA